MNSIYKFILTILIFFVLLLAIDRSAALILDKIYFSQENELKYALKDCKDDILILGSSRASHHYIPSIIEDSLDMRCINLGKDGQNIFYHYAILTTVLSHHTPQLVIYDLYENDFIITDSKFDKDQLDRLAPLYGYNEIVDNIIGLKGIKYEWALNIFRTFKYNSSLSTIIKGFEENNSSILIHKGYLPIYGVWNKNIENSQSTIKEYSNEKISYIKKIIDICNMKNIKLIVTVSPKYSVDPESIKVYEPIKTIIKNNEVTYLYYEHDSILLSTNKNFKDILHLNHTGATKYSNLISKKLKEIYTKNTK